MTHEVYSCRLPHSVIHGSADICSSPRLIAACHDLHRLPVPRHPPCALVHLTNTPSTLACVNVLDLISVRPHGRRSSAVAELPSFRTSVPNRITIALMFSYLLFLRIEQTLVRTFRFSRLSYLDAFSYMRFSRCVFEEPCLLHFFNSGSHLPSRTVSSAVLSAGQVLTVVFGMGTGVTPDRIAARFFSP